MKKNTQKQSSFLDEISLTEILALMALALLLPVGLELLSYLVGYVLA